jgi:CNT family concentrative nucleoside transporter
MTEAITTEWGLRVLSGVGFFVLLGIAWLCSSARRAIDWRAIAWGVGFQFALALLLLGTRAGQLVFAGAEIAIDR